MNIKQYKSPNITKGRSGYKPDIIVCHITEGSFNGAVSWLCNTQSQASTHFVVAKDGSVAQLVSLEDTAWGNGTTTITSDSRYYGHSAVKKVRDRKTSANFYTISIEHEGFYKDGKGKLTEKQERATSELIKHIRSEVKRIYGVTIPLNKEHIVGHCHIAPKWKPNCPGEAYPYDAVIKWAEVVDDITPSSASSVQGPKATTLTEEQATILLNGEEMSITRILKDGTNYIRLRDLEKLGFSIDYDEQRKMPVVNFTL